MIFISILILIVAIALPSINKLISPILLARISSIVFIYAGVLSFNALYIQSIGSGIGIYSG
jgi:NADH-ubiquinone oxidoreductase chain 2